MCKRLLRWSREAFFVGAGRMGSGTREIVMAFSREFGETESPPRWDMEMERCLGRWLKGPFFCLSCKVR